jgi:hypothetical protein
MAQIDALTEKRCRELPREIRKLCRETRWPAIREKLPFSLENRRGRKLTVGSNPTTSATISEYVIELIYFYWKPQEGGPSDSPSVITHSEVAQVSRAENGRALRITDQGRDGALRRPLCTSMDLMRCSTLMVRLPVGSWHLGGAPSSCSRSG